MKNITLALGRVLSLNAYCEEEQTVNSEEVRIVMRGNLVAIQKCELKTA